MSGPTALGALGLVGSHRGEARLERRQALDRRARPRELLAVTLGAFAYVAVFGLVHLLSRRGLIIGIVVFFVFDAPLGRIPFSLRNISPSYHVGVVANQQENMELPISFGQPETSVIMSALILLAIAIVFLAATAAGFTRKNLVDLS